MPRALVTLGAIAALMVWPMLGLADGYTAAVPIVNGDVHQARQEALKLIFLEAGQTGNVSVSTRSMLLNGELTDAVRFDARYRLKNFQIRHEKIADGYLTVSARVDSFPEDLEICPQSVAFPRFKYQWSAPEPSTDPEAEIIFRLALESQLHQSDLDLLFPAQTQASAAYALQFKLQGESGLLSTDLKIEVSAVGQGGSLVEQWIFPFSGGGLTQWQRQSVGSAVLKSRVLSTAAREWIAEVVTALKVKLPCLPAVLPATLNRYQKTQLILGDGLSSHPLPTVFFSRSWPIQRGGAIDLHKIDAVLTAHIEGKKMTLEPLSSPEGQRSQPRSQPNPTNAAFSGFLIVY